MIKDVIADHFSDNPQGRLPCHLSDQPVLRPGGLDL